MSNRNLRPDYYYITLPDGYVLEVRLLIEALGCNFNHGAALKHLCRVGRKGPAIEDFAKSRTYCDYEVDRLMREAMAEEPEPHEIEVEIDEAGPIDQREYARALRVASRGRER